MLSTVTISFWSKNEQSWKRAVKDNFRKKGSHRTPENCKNVKLDTTDISPYLSSIVYIVSNFIQTVANMSKITCWS